MAAWFNAPLLEAIRASANAVAPGRSTASDGTIGDPAHAARVSDHNPDTRGMVHAIDVTHDPVRGFDQWSWANWLRDRCRSGIETRIKYIVAGDPAQNHDVIASQVDNWTWRLNHTGKDHFNHLHVSILYTAEAENSTEPLFFLDSPPATPEDDVTPEQLDAALTAVIERECKPPDGLIYKCASSALVRTAEDNDRFRRAIRSLAAPSVPKPT